MPAELRELLAGAGEPGRSGGDRRARLYGVTRPPMTPSSPGVSERMARVRQRDTAPELELRSELHRRGFRYRVDRRPLAGVPSRADLVFGPARVAVYVDGCFWHSCPEHGTMPRSNEAFWQEKLARNRERDAAVDGALAAAGWTVVRIWEHEEIDAAADRVEAAVKKSRE